MAYSIQTKTLYTPTTLIISISFKKLPI